jgi:hypothetical protein
MIIYSKFTADAKVSQNTTINAKKYLSRKFGIDGGADAAAGAYPHAVYLAFIPSNTYCGGTLFAFNLVVTAGMLNKYSESSSLLLVVNF